MLLAQLRPAIVSLILFTVLTGVIYPLVVTAIAQTIFHKQAEGSLIYSGDGKILGSSLIGQNFDDPKYFWGRISATSPFYNASSSSGSGLDPHISIAAANYQLARVARVRGISPDALKAIVEQNTQGRFLGIL